MTVETAAPAMAHPQPAERSAPLVRQLLIVLVLAVVVAGAWLVLGHADHGPEAGPSAPPDPLAVAALTVQPQDVPIVTEFLAQTEPSASVAIRARVGGVLVDRTFEEGQPVHAGEVLFRIDPEPFEVALRQARAGLAAAQAQHERALQQVKRFQGLAELQRAATNELEQAQEDLRVGAANVETEEALVERARLDLEYATVVSPIDGVIGRREEDVGNLVGGAAGETLLATVRRVDPLYVRFSVSERELVRWQRLTEAGLVSDVPADQLAVRVVLPDGRSLPQPGRIDYVDVAVDPSTGTAVVRASVPNPDGMLRPGQYVKVAVSGARRLGALVVPRTAVLQAPGGASVYVAEDGRAELRSVQLGEWTDDGWIVEQGLAPGDVVLTDHLLQLRAGAAVAPHAS